MKETFIDPLLHPFSSAGTPLSASTPNLDYDYYRAESPLESTDHLPPIAARFMSPTPTTGHPPGSGPSSIRNKDTPNIDGESLDTDEEAEGDDRIGKGYSSRRQDGSKHDHPRSPYRATATKTSTRQGGTSVPFPSRSHQSLPPPARANPMAASTQSLGRQSTTQERERERNHSQGQSSKHTTSQKPGMLKKFRKNQNSVEDVFGGSIAPQQLPEDLRVCLEVIDNGVLEGHKRLSEALKKRYDDQFPLVRSLADVFVANVRHSCLWTRFPPLTVPLLSPTYLAAMGNTCFIWSERLSKSIVLCPTCLGRSPRSKIWVNGRGSAKRSRKWRKAQQTRAKPAWPSPYRNRFSDFSNIPSSSKIFCSTLIRARTNTKVPCKWSRKSKPSFGVSRTRRSRRKSVTRHVMSSPGSRAWRRSSNWLCQSHRGCLLKNDNASRHRLNQAKLGNYPPLLLPAPRMCAGNRLSNVSATFYRITVTALAERRTYGWSSSTMSSYNVSEQAQRRYH